MRFTGKLSEKGLSVNTALRAIRNLWIIAQLKAPSFAQYTLIPRLQEAKEIGRLLVRPGLPIYQLQGQRQCGPLTVSYVGFDYSRPLLKSILFAGAPMERKVGQIPFWRCREVADWSSSDIVIVDAVKQLIHKLPCQNAIVLPPHVDHILDVSGDWQAVKSRFRKSIQNELRLTRKYGYQYEVSQCDQDFEMFYKDMYLPTMENRHGALASPVPIYEARQYFRHGFLFLVKRDGQPVCGSVCYPRQDMLDFIIAGVIDGDQQRMKEGAIGALNCLRICWANEHGYRAVNFMGTAPYLNMGLFQQKRHWGTTLSVSRSLQRRLWLGIRHKTPAVSQFLKENPFVVVGEDGKLDGLIIVDDPSTVSDEARKEWKARYATPGLSSLVIRSVNSFTEKSENDNIPKLIIPILPQARAEGNHSDEQSI